MGIDGIKVVESETSAPGRPIESFILSNKGPIIISLLGLLLVGLGFSYFKSQTAKPQVEIVTNQTEVGGIVVEIAGAVEKPGVFELPNGARIEDLLVVAGGVAVDADRVWMEKSLNRAAKLTDAQKIYVPYAGEQSQGATANNYGQYQSTSGVIGTQNSGLTNINTATLAEIDKLPGIGPVYGQRIIDQRPYSEVKELVTRDVIPDATYKKIENLVSVY